jgi:hypothetical protein
MKTQSYTESPKCTSNTKLGFVNLAKETEPVNEDSEESKEMPIEKWLKLCFKDNEISMKD